MGVPKSQGVKSSSQHLSQPSENAKQSFFSKETRERTHFHLFNFLENLLLLLLTGGVWVKDLLEFVDFFINSDRRFWFWFMGSFRCHILEAYSIIIRYANSKSRWIVVGKEGKSHGFFEVLDGRTRLGYSNFAIFITWQRILEGYIIKVRWLRASWHPQSIELKWC